jgi:predicted ribonuclease YlaK
MLTHVKELIVQNAEKMRLHWKGAPLGIYSAGIGKRQLGEPITFAGIQSVRAKAALLGHIDLVIVDEAQSLERNVLLTVLSRIGKDSRVVLTHDVAQRDNLRVGRHDGVVAVVEKLKGHPLFAHVTLNRSERSPIAALVTDMLEDLPA